MKPETCCFLLLILSGSSCITPRAYFMSPMDINGNPYVTLPAITDSQKSATYGNLAINGGGSNQTLKDGVIGGRLSIHRGYRFGNFQAYYGGGLSMGNYNVHDAYHFGNLYYNSMNDTSYHYRASNNFYGSYGLNGGMNLIIPFANGRGEWRVIGFETSFQKEFGDYINYRKRLPDSAFNILATYGHMFTLGGTTELVGISRHGTAIGYKFALGTILFPVGNYLGDESNFRPYYMYHTLHLTRGKVTGFLQFNIGAHAASLQFGVNYNLSKKAEL